MVTFVRWKQRFGLFLSGEGDQRDVPASLNRNSYFSLVPCAIAGNAAGKYLAPFRQKELQCLYILVIDEGGLVNAETADFPPDLEPSLLVRTPAVLVPAPALRPC